MSRAGIGAPIEPEAAPTVRTLRIARQRKNKDLIKYFKEDTHFVKLLESCKEDAALGQMSMPRSAHECDLSATTLSPRFAVQQGTYIHACLDSLHIVCVHCAGVAAGVKDDGTPKIRPIDDMTRRVLR